MCTFLFCLRSLPFFPLFLSFLPGLPPGKREYDPSNPDATEGNANPEGDRQDPLTPVSYCRITSQKHAPEPHHSMAATPESRVIKQHQRKNMLATLAPNLLLASPSSGRAGPIMATSTASFRTRLAVPKYLQEVLGHLPTPLCPTCGPIKLCGSVQLPKGREPPFFCSKQVPKSKMAVTDFLFCQK